MEEARDKGGSKKRCHSTWDVPVLPLTYPEDPGAYSELGKSFSTAWHPLACSGYKVVSLYMTAPTLPCAQISKVTILKRL
jgi:hypothetical protein